MLEKLKKVEEKFDFISAELCKSEVVSDMELDTSATESSDESDDIVVTPVDPVTPVNPGTGARA